VIHEAPNRYAEVALERECAAMAGATVGRNDRLNSAAFNLGQFVGGGYLDRSEVEQRLLAAAEECGYLQKDGRMQARATIRSGIEKGMRKPREVPESAKKAAPEPSKPKPQIAGVPLPAWTVPSENGKPRFSAIGEEAPPSFEGELRRHIYRRDGQNVRVKIKRAGGGFVDVYRVVRDDGAIGWQAAKPEGYIPAPYTGPRGAADPFDPEHKTELLFWPEGEKDVDTLQAVGFLAFTFGGSNDVPDDLGNLVKGRDVVIPSDNDEAGRKCAARKAEVALKSATRVRIVHFPEVKEKGDVSDWINDFGGTTDRLLERIEAAEPETPTKPVISATPFVWPTVIPPREWIYGFHYIRQFVSTTISPGGIGKSSLTMAEALAICTGKPLLGLNPNERVNCWLWNGEDPKEELDRRLVATCTHYGLTPQDLEGRLFVDSGRRMPIVLAEQTRDGTVISVPVVDAVKQAIRANKIGVMTVDPFISSHRVTENDNNAIDLVAKTWAQIADETGCAIELVHHARKANGNEVTVEDGRGAVALLSASRASRALNVMSEEEAIRAGVDNRRVFFRAVDGKANLAPPSDKSTWFKLVSVDLMNGTEARPSDHVGVVTSWGWPDPMEGVTVEDLRRVQERVSRGQWRESVQSPQWVGFAVAEVLRLNATDPADQRKIKDCLKSWVQNKVLRVVLHEDAKGNSRPFVEVGEWAT
jgi:hypothetical protein